MNDIKLKKIDPMLMKRLDYINKHYSNSLLKTAIMAKEINERSRSPLLETAKRVNEFNERYKSPLLKATEMVKEINERSRSPLLEPTKRVNEFNERYKSPLLKATEMVKEINERYKSPLLETTKRVNEFNERYKSPLLKATERKNKINYYLKSTLKQAEECKIITKEQKKIINSVFENISSSKNINKLEKNKKIISKLNNIHLEQEKKLKNQINTNNMNEDIENTSLKIEEKNNTDKYRFITLIMLFIINLYTLKIKKLETKIKIKTAKNKYNLKKKIKVKPKFQVGEIRICKRTKEKLVYSYKDENGFIHAKIKK